MKKRVLATILILLIILPTVAVAAAVVFAPKTAFDIFDKARNASLSAALSEKTKIHSVAAKPLSDSGRYIVKFKNEIPLVEIEKALGGLSYHPLAETEQRIFAVSDAEFDFIESNSEIIDYAEPDLQRGTLSATNDPVSVPALEQMSFGAAWEKAQANADIIVAVLDTGVDRTHEDLLNVNILSGYDSVSKTAGVDSDEAGHGTGVIGIIAATSDNGLGIAGAASGVTILPIKVSSSGEVIYSSDLISGIRFAADAGAKIINMSVGGYSSSYAEQDAVNYAVSKGCILIAAAGNGGDRTFGDQKSYPASYDGVISVASCDSLGNRSSFSQYNDAVDVTAPGENVAMPYCEDGRSVYRTDSGTSYSCAYVSAIAALAASYIEDGIRFNSDEFLALIIETCSIKRTDEYGHGIINADKIVSIARDPIIIGVANGGIYSGSVNIGFNRGNATLDYEPFEDGEAVVGNGPHILTVTDGETEKSIRFRLDYDPLTVEFKEFSAFSYFEFERGSALLNGFPYFSGMRITASGRQHFILTDGEERIEREVFLGYTLPTVFGIENGGVYNTPVSVKIIGNGSAELNGELISNEFSLFQSGSYVLTVYSENGAMSADYAFDIDFPYGHLINSDYAGARAAIDEENGYICIYGETLTGIRIYDLEAPEQYLHFIHTGQIYSHRFIGNSLVLIGEDGVTFINRELALNSEECIEKTLSANGISLYAFGGDEIYCFGNEMIYTLDTESGELSSVAGLGFDCELALYSNGRFCLASPYYDSTVRIFDIESGELRSFEPSIPFEHEPFFFEGDILAIGGTLLNTESGEILLETASDSVVAITDSAVVTESSVIDIESGKETATLPFSVCYITETESSRYIFGWDCEIAIISLDAEGLYSYGASESIESFVSDREIVNEYRTNAFIGKGKTAFSATASQNTVYYLLSGENALFSLNVPELTENLAIPLRFVPSSVNASDGLVSVCFANAPFVYIAEESDLANGRYIKTPNACTSALTDGGIFVAASGGRLIHGPIGGTNLTATDIPAEQIALNGDRYAVTYNNNLFLYDLLFRRIAFVRTAGGRLSFGNCISVGNTVYDPTDLSAVAKADSKIVAFSGETAIAENSVFDLSIGGTLGHLAVKKATAAAICGNNALVAFGNGLVTVCAFEDGTLVNASPEISGAENGGVYLDTTVITFLHGMGFLGNDPFFSGEAVPTAGVHKFTVALPCGRSVSVDFSVEARLTAIEFLGGDRTMSVGEKITLRIRYLPEGASSLPVSFSCDSKGITVSESGEVTANEIGEYRVTAQAVTEGRPLSAECIITVRNDLIAFKPESGITVDRDNALAIAIPAGTDEKALHEMLVSDKRITVSDKNGNAPKGYIGTGFKITLKAENGETADSLTAVVIGDTDGDGFVSAYDIYVLEQILGNKRFETAFLSAADLNRNGVLADNDLKLLKNAVLGKTEMQNGEPSANLFGRGSVQTVSRIESGEIIDVAVCLSGCKYAKAISGVIAYSEGLEFVGSESLGWKMSTSNTENGVAFYAYDKKGKDCGKAFKVILNLKFRVTAEAGKTVGFSTEWLTASFGNDCRLIHFESQELFVYSADIGEFSFDIHNAYSFEFKSEQTEYNVVIPYNSALADISFKRGEDQNVTADGLVVSDSEESIINVSCTDADGNTRYYTVNVKRDSEPRFETDCRLATLEIEGFRLNPAFHPDVFEYKIEVPYGTQKINLYYTAQSKTAQVVVSGTEINGENGEITITVILPDGESLGYTVGVSVLPEQTESSEISEYSEPDPNNDTSGWMIFAAIGLAVTAITVIVLYIRLAKRDEEVKASEHTNE